MSKERHPQAIEFGKAFVAITRAHNRTPKSLHTELEVSDSYISNISTGKRIPNPQLLGDYLAALEPLTDCELNLLLEPYVALLVGGFVPPEKGALSPNGRKRLIQANEQREFTPELRERMSIVQRGKKHTSETIHKMQQSHIGQRVSLETREKIRRKNQGQHPWNLGIPQSEEAKEKIREYWRREKEAKNFTS